MRYVNVPSEFLSLQAGEAAAAGFALTGYGKDLASIMDKVSESTVIAAEERLAALESYVDRAPKYEGKVYRGMGFVNKQQALEFIEEMQTSHCPTFSSWSADRGVAESFASLKNTSYKRAAVLLTHSNVHGVSIAGHAAMDEKEVLQPPGIRYEIHSITEREETLQTAEGGIGPTVTIYELDVRPVERVKMPRLDAAGKPCGESFISAGYDCHKGEGESPASQARHTAKVIVQSGDAKRGRIRVAVITRPPGGTDQDENTYSVEAQAYSDTIDTSEPMKKEFAAWLEKEARDAGVELERDGRGRIVTRDFAYGVGVGMFGQPNFAKMEAIPEADRRLIARAAFRTIRQLFAEVPEGGVVTAYAYSSDGHGARRKKLYQSLGLQFDNPDYGGAAFKKNGKLVTPKPAPPRPPLPGRGDSLEGRLDALQARFDKPCGRSFIPEHKVCRKGAGEAPAPAAAASPKPAPKASPKPKAAPKPKAKASAPPVPAAPAPPRPKAKITRVTTNARKPGPSGGRLAVDVAFPDSNGKAGKTYTVTSLVTKDVLWSARESMLTGAATRQWLEGTGAAHDLKLPTTEHNGVTELAGYDVSFYVAAPDVNNGGLNRVETGPGQGAVLARQAFALSRELISKLPDGAVVVAYPWSGDGRQAARRKMYEAIGFSFQGPSEVAQGYAIKQGDRLITPEPYKKPRASRKKRRDGLQERLARLDARIKQAPGQGSLDFTAPPPPAAATGTGKPCGESHISSGYTCHVGGGEDAPPPAAKERRPARAKASQIERVLKLLPEHPPETRPDYDPELGVKSWLEDSGQPLRLNNREKNKLYEELQAEGWSSSSDRYGKVTTYAKAIDNGEPDMQDTLKVEVRTWGPSSGGSAKLIRAYHRTMTEADHAAVGQLAHTPLRPGAVKVFGFARANDGAETWLPSFTPSKGALGELQRAAGPARHQGGELEFPEPHELAYYGKWDQQRTWTSTRKMGDAGRGELEQQLLAEGFTATGHGSFIRERQTTNRKQEAGGQFQRAYVKHAAIKDFEAVREVVSAWGPDVAYRRTEHFLTDQPYLPDLAGEPVAITKKQGMTEEFHRFNDGRFAIHSHAPGWEDWRFAADQQALRERYQASLEAHTERDYGIGQNARPRDVTIKAGTILQPWRGDSLQDRLDALEARLDRRRREAPGQMALDLTGTGQPCGESFISAGYTCHKGEGTTPPEEKPTAAPEKKRASVTVFPSRHDDTGGKLEAEVIFPYDNDPRVDRRFRVEATIAGHGAMYEARTTGDYANDRTRATAKYLEESAAAAGVELVRNIRDPESRRNDNGEIRGHAVIFQVLDQSRAGSSGFSRGEITTAEGEILARTAFRLLKQLTAKLPDGAVLECTAWTADGKGKQRQKMYETLGFQFHNPSNPDGKVGGLGLAIKRGEKRLFRPPPLAREDALEDRLARLDAKIKQAPGQLGLFGSGGGPGTGKPCGESFIASSYTCGKATTAQPKEEPAPAGRSIAGNFATMPAGLVKPEQFEGFLAAMEQAPGLMGAHARKLRQFINKIDPQILLCRPGANDKEHPAKFTDLLLTMSNEGVDALKSRLGRTTLPNVIEGRKMGFPEAIDGFRAGNTDGIEAYYLNTVLQLSEHQNGTATKAFPLVCVSHGPMTVAMDGDARQRVIEAKPSEAAITHLRLSTSAIVLAGSLDKDPEAMERVRAGYQANRTDFPMLTSESRALEDKMMRVRAAKADAAARFSMESQGGGNFNDHMNTLIHEIGHQVRNSLIEISGATLNKPPPTIAYKDSRGETRLGTYSPSTYGELNYEENFAESFVAYVVAPEALQTVAPEHYRWVERHLNMALNREGNGPWQPSTNPTPLMERWASRASLQHFLRTTGGVKR